MVEIIVSWKCPYCGVILDDQNSECGCSIKYAPYETADEPFIPIIWI